MGLYENTLKNHGIIWDYEVFMGIPFSNEPIQQQIMGMFTDQKYEKVRVAGSLQEWAKKWGTPKSTNEIWCFQS